jgi:tRNA 2-selenouridine synthase
VSEKINIHLFLLEAKTNPIIDVRSEDEFASGHIPNAINIPILSNQERVIVGTIYKKFGKQKAILKGLELSGPHFAERLKLAIKQIGDSNPLVHCWRGGMRSFFYSNLLEFYGYTPKLLDGGYKAFRQFVFKYFETSFQFKVIGGKTGVGKTKILQKMKESGFQVIDLEGLANHKGSAFGGIGLGNQPTQEQFENNLFQHLHRMDSNLPIWIENENRTIGDKVIPVAIWDQMMNADLLVLEGSKEKRLETIVGEYGRLDINDLKFAFEKISKRIGPQHYKSAIQDLENGNIQAAFAHALSYYDKSYVHNLEKIGRVPKSIIDVEGQSFEQIITTLLDN